MKIAYFTSGTIGAGHLTRGLALGQALRRLGFKGTYRIFTTATLQVDRAALLGHDVLAYGWNDAASIRDGVGLIKNDLRAFAPDLLIVDMFWATVAPLIASIDAAKWLLIRSCPKRWLEGPPELSFDAGLYDRVIGIEPLPHHTLEDTVDPVVICNPGEIDPRARAVLDEALDLDPALPLTLVVQAGVKGEQELLMQDAARVQRGQRACSSLHEDKAIYPIASLLPGADVLVGASGYNFYWETVWLGLRPRTHYRPFARGICDQAWRKKSCRFYTPTVNGADVLAKQMWAI